MEITAIEVIIFLLGLIVFFVWLYGLKNYIFSTRTILEPMKGYSSGSENISIIIAARNEQENIYELLTLLTSNIVNEANIYEVVIVDDESTDSTPDIIKKFTLRDNRIRLIRTDYSRLESFNWQPKTYALWRGYREARGDILVFLDADTMPRDMDTIVSTILLLLRSDRTREDSRAIIAFVPRFSCKNILCKATESMYTGIVHSFYGFNRVVNRDDSLAWMYGCCWAIRRKLYEQLGGHRAVKNSIVEDRDFARLAKRRGISIIPINGTKCIDVIAWENVRDYIELTARLSRDKARREGSRVYLYAFMVAIALYSPLFFTLIAIGSKSAIFVPFISAFIAQLAIFSLGARFNHYSIVYGLLAPFLQFVIIAGILKSKKRIVWKERVLD